MRTYEQASNHLAGGRSKDYRPLTGRSTSLERRDEHTIAVRYHATDVVTYRDDGTVTLESGGYRTMTTKDRMCAYSPVKVSQANGIWYVGPPWGDDARLYQDGLIVRDNGELVNAQPVEATERTEKVKRRLDRMVSKYVRGFGKHLIEVGHLEQPSNGDCWGCLMVDASSKKGDMMGFDHLVSHMRESYFVPSLFSNALKARGYRDPAFIASMINRDLADGSVSHSLSDTLRYYFRTRKHELVKVLLEEQPQRRRATA